MQIPYQRSSRSAFPFTDIHLSFLTTLSDEKASAHPRRKRIESSGRCARFHVPIWLLSQPPGACPSNVERIDLHPVIICVVCNLSTVQTVLTKLMWIPGSNNGTFVLNTLHRFPSNLRSLNSSASRSSCRCITTNPSTTLSTCGILMCSFT